MIYWPFDPTVDVGLVILAVAYAWLGRRTGITTRGRLYFTLGLLTIWAALETPLDPLGDYYLQSAHMVQHMLLTVALPLQFSRTLFYRPYAQAPMLVSGIDHVIDQTIAGVLMFSMDMVVMAFDALVVFLRLVRLEQEAADSQLGHTSSSGGSSQHEA